MPLPHGWHGSVGFGGTYNQPAAWILAANFRLAPSAASHEGGSPVPPHRIKIAIGDFPTFGVRWRRVSRLTLPEHLPALHVRQMGGSYWSLTRRVRFAGRAVLVAVSFGSRPDARMRAEAISRLAAVQPLRR
jgi:hypothetical protein